MDMGVIHRDDLFRGDPDNPNNPNRPAVKDATRVINWQSGFTSQLPSQPIKSNDPGQTVASRTEAAYQLGLGPNNLLSKAWYNINPKDTQFGGAKPTPELATTPRTGAGGSGGMSLEQALALAKFNYDKEQDAATRATALEALQFGRNRDAGIASGYTDYYGGGEGAFNTGFNKLLEMITAQGGVSEGNIGKAYDRATTNIDEGYDVASGLGDKGYSALNTYLQANPNNPYAGMTAQTGTPADAMSQFLQAYGVDDTPVKAQVQADELQAQQGAGNFQNLIDVLSGVAQQGAASRGAESQMSQLMFNTGLGQDRAGYTSQAENAQAQALAALQQQMFQSRFGVQGDRNSLANQLATAVIQAGGSLGGGGTGSSTGKTTDEDTGGGGVGPLPGQLAETATPQQIVANQLANLLAPAQAQGNTAQQLLDQLNERRRYVQQQPVMNPQIQAVLQQIAAQQVAGNSSGGGQKAGTQSGGGRGNLMDMF